MNPTLHNILPVIPVELPETYYDINRKEYLAPDARGDWIPLNETQFKRFLKFYGISASPVGPGQLSPVDSELIRMMRERGVHYAGPLAGYRKGLYESGTSRLLVTSSPRLIVPAPGPFPTITALLAGLLNSEIQRHIFYGWLKVALHALRDGRLHPGQALVLVGPRNAGKSVLQNLLTEMLGGRAAKPYQFMTDRTPFNADHFGAEHLMIEDESPSTDMRARRAFGAQIKNITVCDVQRLHAKHRDALALKPFWRLTISVNDEPENVMVLPPIDESILDKIILFRTERNPMPMPTLTPEERKAFWNQLLLELPGFLDFISSWTIPPELRCPRFGIVHYHHPHILSLLDELAPELRLLSLLDHVYFSPNSLVKSPDRLELTAEQIEADLTGQYAANSHEARKLLSWPAACGTYLGRLAKKYPERIKSHRTAEVRNWILLPPTRAPEAA